MSKAHFKLHEFEYLAASEDAVLLRVAGRWSRPPEGADLVATTPEDRLTLESLPQAPSTDGVWRAAYSAPAGLLDGPRPRFHLVTADGVSIALPLPAERAVGVPRKPEPKPRMQVAELLARRRDSRRLAKAKRVFGDEAGPVLERERSARLAAERAAKSERAERERATAELREAVRRASGERARFLEWIEGNAEQRAHLERALTTERERAEAALAAERERAEQLLADERERSEKEVETLRETLDRTLAERESALGQERRRAEELVAEERKRADGDAASLREELDRALAAREASLEEERRRAERLVADERERSEAEVASIRAQLGSAEQERDEACALAEERLAAVRTAGRRLARLQARIDDEVAAQTREARASEHRALAQAEALRSRVGELEDVVVGLVAGIEDGERRLAQAEELTQQLRAAIARTEQQRPRTPNLGRLRDNIDRRLARLEQLERQADALRNAIHERIATQGGDPGQEQLFEAPVDERDPVPA